MQVFGEWSRCVICLNKFTLLPTFYVFDVFNVVEVLCSKQRQFFAYFPLYLYTSTCSNNKKAIMKDEEIKLPKMHGIKCKCHKKARRVTKLEKAKQKPKPKINQ